MAAISIRPQYITSVVEFMLVSVYPVGADVYLRD